MYTKDDLIQCLYNMGLTGKESIIVHSSMKAIGEVDKEVFAGTVCVKLMRRKFLMYVINCFPLIRKV